MLGAPMKEMATGHRLAIEDLEGIAILRGLLKSATYTESEVRRACAVGTTGVIPRAEQSLIVRKLPQEGLLPVLIRLFMLGVAVDRDIVARDLKPLTPERLKSLGLVRAGPGGLVPLVKFTPFDNLVLAGDPHHDDPLEVPADYVIGVNQTSAHLVGLTIRRPVKAALDLGTGCGIAGLYAARYAERVVATDINPRALNFTAFNALLNEIRNVEVRQGSLFEPVAGETFDLVMSNPPYVISPDSDYQFRDSGLGGDSLCRSLVRDLPRHLREGGYASILSNWALRPGQHWSDPVREWIRDSGCDALMLFTETSTPLIYAGNWNRPLLPKRLREYEEAVDRWVAFFKRSGIEGVAMGGLVVRRRGAGPNWVAAEEIPIAGDIGTSEQILRIFEACDWLAEEPEFLAAKFRPVDDMRFDQTVSFRDGEMSIREVRFSMARGFKMEGQLDPRTMLVIGHCDGKRSLGEILDRIGPPGGEEVKEVRNHIAGVIRKLFALGFLVRT